MKHPAGELLPILKQVSVFGGLDDATINRIFTECETVVFKQDDVIIKENSPGKDMFIIVRGRVKIVLEREGQSIEVTQFGPGNCLGEVSMIGILNHSASVIALEETELLVISKKLLMEILQADKDVFSIMILNIARELARRLYNTNEVLLHYGKKKIDMLQ